MQPGYLHDFKLHEEGADVVGPQHSLSCLLPPTGIFEKVCVVIHCSLEQKE